MKNGLSINYENVGVGPFSDNPEVYYYDTENTNRSADWTFIGASFCKSNNTITLCWGNPVDSGHGHLNWT